MGDDVILSIGEHYLLKGKPFTSSVGTTNKCQDKKESFLKRFGLENVSPVKILIRYLSFYYLKSYV